jgi:hypothetical protein
MNWKSQLDGKRKLTLNAVDFKPRHVVIEIVLQELDILGPFFDVSHFGASERNHDWSLELEEESEAYFP